MLTQEWASHTCWKVSVILRRTMRFRKIIDSPALREINSRSSSWRIYISIFKSYYINCTSRTWDLQRSWDASHKNHARNKSPSFVDDPQMFACLLWSIRSRRGDYCGRSSSVFYILYLARDDCKHNVIPSWKLRTALWNAARK